jgi:hypothetical protein
MKTVAGIFGSRKAAERAWAQLKSKGFTEGNLILLTPDASQSEIGSVPTEEGEQPGMGTAIGGVVGGAVGLAAGSTLANIFLPGVGPVIALGLSAAGLGAVTGATGGGALERMLTKGLPKDEIFFYEDALRQGRSVVVVLSPDEDRVESARGILGSNGAESLDAAREKWWIGLRDAEETEYSHPRAAFEQVEKIYRRGFEAAQEPELRGKTLAEAGDILRQRFPTIMEEEPFRRGYMRGQIYASQRPSRDDKAKEPAVEKP